MPPGWFLPASRSFVDENRGLLFYKQEVNMENATEQDLMNEKLCLFYQAKKSLINMFDSNGYMDEFIGSWHRYVDTQEKIANALAAIADKMEDKSGE
jgi:hypothetical protein